MLDMLFGFNARLGRLKFFLFSILLGVVNGIIAIPVAYYAYKHGLLHGALPKSIWSLGWPIIAFVVFWRATTCSLRAFSRHRMGDPIIVMVSCWIAVVALDPLIASRVPAMALEKHDGTVVGGLINLGLIVILLFWPSGDHVGSPPVFDDPAPPPSRPSNSPVSSERMARATAQFGRRRARQASPRSSALAALLRAGGHAQELAKRIERPERNQLETHQMRLPQRQLFQHVMRGRDIGDVEDEGDAALFLERVPLVDLAIEIELGGLAHFRRQNGAGSREIDAGVQGADGENSCGRRRRGRGLRKRMPAKDHAKRNKARG